MGNHITRNNTIDALRFFFAFCVVCIHVPLLGGKFATPIFRCAVPFFYMVSGYYLYSGDFNSKLKRNIRKWFILWVKYFVIIGIISIILHSIFKQKVMFHFDDIISIFLLSGTTTALDKIIINGNTTGLYTIWFLLGGAYSFLFYYIFQRYIGNKGLNILVGLIFVSGIILSAVSIKIPRWVYLSIPYVGLGMLARKVNTNPLNKSKCMKILCVSLFIVVSLEFLISRLTSHIQLETTIFTPVFMICFFLLVLNTNIHNKLINGKIAELGRSTTMDIYIFHRPIYATMLAITPPICIGFIK